MTGDAPRYAPGLFFCGTNMVKIGDESCCIVCGKPVVFNGQAWTHRLDVEPRHQAEPMGVGGAEVKAVKSVMVEPFSLAGVRCMGEQDGCGEVVVKLHFGAIRIVLCEACRNRIVVGLGVDAGLALAAKTKEGKPM